MDHHPASHSIGTVCCYWNRYSGIETHAHACELGFWQNPFRTISCRFDPVLFRFQQSSPGWPAFQLSLSSLYCSAWGVLAHRPKIYIVLYGLAENSGLQQLNSSPPLHYFDYMTLASKDIINPQSIGTNKHTDCTVLSADYVFNSSRLYNTFGRLLCSIAVDRSDTREVHVVEIM